jgi:hypothetical protein
MRSDKPTNKSRGILKAIGKGQSCEQILANDRTLTYHDIFHAMTEAPTSHWRRDPDGNPVPAVRQRSD